MPVSGSPESAKQPSEYRVSIPQIMLFQAAALIMRGFIQVGLVDSGNDPEFANYFSVIAGFAILGMLMWPVLSNVLPAIRQQFRRPVCWIRMSLASVALGVVLWLCQMLTLLATAPLGWPEAGPRIHPTLPEYQFFCSETAILLLSIPVMSIMTPLIEEVINRGLILRALLARGRVAAVLSSAFLFAVLHEPAAMPYAVFFGIFVAVQMIHYRNLWAVIITHGVTNLLVAVSNTCLSGHWLPGRIAWTAGSPATLIALSLILCLLVAWRLATSTSAGAESI